MRSWSRRSAPHVRIPDVNDVKIPKLEDAELTRRQALHLPLVQGDGGRFLTVPEHDIRRTSYPWIEKLGPAAEPGPIIGTSLTLHGYGYYGFKPSVAEVLCQIPEPLVDVPTWFLVTGPGMAEDFYESLESKDQALVRELLEAPPDDSVQRAFEAGFHTARTVFFKR